MDVYEQDGMDEADLGDAHNAIRSNTSCNALALHLLA